MSENCVAQRMRAALEQRLNPVELEVIDDSHKHVDHYVHAGGADHGGQTHFKVRVVSAAFAGKSRLQRHRVIHELLALELAGGVHALAIDAKAPGE